MWATNLKILGVVIGTIALYTLIANAIPQVESDVPEELTFTGEVTAEQLVAAGEELYESSGGCTACHGLGTRAPNLLEGDDGEGPIGARCADRVEGMDCKAYLHESMIEPNEYVVEGFEPIMPDMRRTLSDPQIWSIVAYLQSLGGEVTVTAEDVEAPSPAPGAAQTAPAATGDGAPVDPGVSNPVAILEAFQCLACHELGERGTAVGPPFTDIGARRDPDHIRRSILEPRTEIAEGYEDFATLMPTDLGERMSATQLEVVVDYLAEQTGESP
ncbi:MAG: c-type cytochrome [Gemmatimonadota bacterium]|nr:c-type cytochrome [Gemmatimonadota bacterium]